MDFHCPICQLIHNTFKRLKKHMARRHSEHEVFECHFCEFITMKVKALAKHKERSHPDEKYSCNKCEFSSTKWKKIQKHYSKIHPAKTEAIDLRMTHRENEQMHEVFQCLFCDMISTKRNILLRHKVSEHPQDNFVCNQCEFSSQKWNKMKKHLLRVHTEVETLHIPTRKLLIGDTQKQSTFKCNCGMMALNETTFMEHKEKIHPLEKLNCSLCEFSTKNFQKLCQHMSNIHSKPSSCSLKMAAILSESKVEMGSGNKVFEGNVSAPRKIKLEPDSSARNGSVKRLKVSELLDNNNKESTVSIITSNVNIMEKSKPSPTGGTGNVSMIEEQIYNCNACSFSTQEKNSFLVHKNSHVSSGSESKRSHESLKASLDSFELPEGLDSDINELTAHNLTSNVNILKSEFSTTGGAMSVPKTENQLYDCDIGGFCTPENRSLFTHMKSHLSSGSKGKHSRDHVHESTVHIVPVPVASNVNIIVNSELSSTEGSRNVPKVKSYIYKCDTCGFSTQEKKSLLAHKNSHLSSKNKGKHSQESMTAFFVCHECDRIFDDMMDLDFHKITHDKLRTFQCENCDRSFCTKWNLKLHIKKHENELPYECHICEYAATQNITLEKHLLRHRELKNFKCKECGYTARVKAHLVVHMRKHTQERPFGCHQCGRRFNQRAHLKNHKARKHRFA